MKAKFWGVRGSIPTPGESTVRYGGNTSCVSIEGDNGELIILDGGSGLRNYGINILETKQFDLSSETPVNPLTFHIFFSHVHWDHIQGIPFFKPLFIKQNSVFMYGEKKVRTSLEDILKGQQQYPNFPISLEEISVNGATIEFTDLFPTQVITIGNVTVSNAKLSHPDGVFAYKVTETTEGNTQTIVYATDTEHRNVLDPRLLKLAQNADILIYDAQYTPEEYSGENHGVPKFDWGHSTYEFAVDTAIRADVKHLILFHHDPEHSDDDIDKIACRARGRAYAIVDSKKMLIDAAKENVEINLCNKISIQQQ